MNTSKRLTFGSLFAGIGGFDLGLERAGMSCVWQVEIDDYASKVLAKHWPKVQREKDIKECSAKNLKAVDLICGGFPCQDISQAGRGAGLAGEKSGLWFEMLRVIGDLQPRWVLVENVSAFAQRGLSTAVSGLSEIGYDCEWSVVSAQDVGAPHIRRRLWLIGRHTNSQSKSAQPVNARASSRLSKFINQSSPAGAHCQSNAQPADTNSKRLESREEKPHAQLSNKQERDSGQMGEKIPHTDNKRVQGRYSQLAAQDQHGQTNTSVPCGANVSDTDSDRLQDSGQGRTETGAAYGSSQGSGREWWATEPAICRVAHGIPRRVDRLKCLGNAVVPQVVEAIGRCIIEADQE